MITTIAKDISKCDTSNFEENKAIVIKHFTLEIEFGSSACGFFVMCLTAMQIHNLPIQPKKKPLWLL